MGPEGLRLLRCVATIISQPCQPGPPSLAWIQRKPQPSGVWGAVHRSGSVSLPAILSAHASLCLFPLSLSSNELWLHIRPTDTRHSLTLFIDGGQAHGQERCTPLATEHSDSWAGEKAWVGAGQGLSSWQVGVKLLHTGGRREGGRYWVSSSLSTRKRA